MAEFINELLPNVVKLWPDFLKAFGDTLIMVGISFVITVAIGLPCGVILMGTQNPSLFYSPIVYKSLSAVIDVLRSTPTVILITAISPLTKLITGTKIGIRGAIVPLVIASAPFLARQVEAALSKLDTGIIRASKSMGDSSFKTVMKVILPEAVPHLIMALTITFVSLINFSAIAGTVGGGGLGDFALRYGYQQFKGDVMVVAIIVLVVLVSLVQWLGKELAKKFTR